MGKTQHRSIAVAIALIAVACIPVGVPAPQIRETTDIGSVPRDDGALKLHMLDGTVYRFSLWDQPDDAARTIAGSGALFGIDRHQISEGRFIVPLDSIALLGIDSRTSVRPFGLSFLATMTTLTTIMTVSCVADPKSCFGSCPTFYLDSDNRDRPIAEGFSSSIARTLEATDIDRLGLTAAAGDTIVLEMRNEALETHAVRYARMLAIPTAAGRDIVADAAGTFYEASDMAPPTACAAAGGDCSGAVAALDLVEYSSLADSADLGALETIHLSFANPGGPLGLVLEARQTFVSTYLIYQAMAYMGREAEYWLAALERHDEAAHAAYAGLMKLTGTIEVFVETSDGGWSSVGEFTEAGPIATDVQAIPIPDGSPGDTVRVRLQMARGGWRIGYAALGHIQTAGQIVTIEPVPFEVEANNPGAFELLNNPDTYLVTHPGDRYRLEYRLPPGDGLYEVFLETRGYYYEWMRQEWLGEENPAMATMLFSNPAGALRVMAPGFKLLEAGFEESFWQSRFGRQQ